MRGDAAFVSLVQELRRWLLPGQTTIVGMCGLPGAGKSTLAHELIDSLIGVRAATVSLDDFYLPRADRLAKGFALRGAPGTHDLTLLDGFLSQLRSRSCHVSLPVFDRGSEERLAPRLCKGPLELCLIEGFLVGIDAPGYELLRTSLSRLIFLDVDPESALLSRRRREAAQRAAGLGGMTDEEVLHFWQHSLWPQVDRYVMPLRERADVVVSLRADHSISMVYFPDGTLRN